MAGKPRSAIDDTKVPVYKSREDIAMLLRQLGVTGVAWMEGDHPDQPGRLLIALRFIRPERIHAGEVPIAVRVLVSVPKVETETEQDQLLRQYHRALFHYLKSQTEAVQFGLVQFTEAFLPHLELGNGLTVFQQIGPQYLRGAATGTIQPLPLLPGP